MGPSSSRALEDNGLGRSGRIVAQVTAIVVTSPVTYRRSRSASSPAAIGRYMRLPRSPLDDGRVIPADRRTVPRRDFAPASTLTKAVGPISVGGADLKHDLGAIAANGCLDDSGVSVRVALPSGERRLCWGLKPLGTHWLLLLRRACCERA